MADRATIYLYTDGAASGNPGPGGYGIVLKCGPLSKELSGGFRLTTNNRMEMMAVIVGLEAINWDGAQVQVYSDSSYVVNTVTHDLWARMDVQLSRLKVNFNWIKGHAGHPENEKCDRLAVAAYQKNNLPPDVVYEETKEEAAGQTSLFNES